MRMDSAYFWFRLFETRGIGPKSLINITKIFERNNLTPNDIPMNKRELTTNYPELAKILVDKIQFDDRERIYQEYEELRAEGIEILYPGHPYYPLKFLWYSERYNISPVLFCKGYLPLFCSDGIAIVGSRNVSEEGEQFAQQIASEIAKSGLNVISGYAKGVDSNAHIGALQAEGTTTIVLSYGIKEFRKKNDFKNYAWDQNMLIVSQFEPNTKWIARNAMARNKLVCALSKGIVVIEAGLEKDDTGKMSGTFAAGKTAIEMKLPLFVMDPSYFKNSPKGNYDLIRYGGIKIDPINGANTIIKQISRINPTPIVENHNELLLQTELFHDRTLQPLTMA
ncbi:SMF family protein [Candidatus Vecturithrix granuli]|uniref:SMF family protein n=1 Tax=Vecturithrix granuli TaxID=1499967 RepID=A0A081BW63_VECG1|nr:SMF family protein [Candidatus Vecturithrix granuli]